MVQSVYKKTLSLSSTIIGVYATPSYGTLFVFVIFFYKYIIPKGIIKIIYSFTSPVGTVYNFKNILFFAEAVKNLDIKISNSIFNLIFAIMFIRSFII